MKVNIGPQEDLQTFNPSEADGQNVLLVDPTHSDEVNRARRRTFHEFNSLTLIRLMKSSTFDRSLRRSPTKNYKSPFSKIPYNSLVGSPKFCISIVFKSLGAIVSPNGN